MLPALFQNPGVAVRAGATPPDGEQQFDVGDLLADPATDFLGKSTSHRRQLMNLLSLEPLARRPN